MHRRPRQLKISLGIGSLLVVAATTGATAQGPGGGGAPAALNRSLDEIRRASVSWERRSGPGRRVVDMVCLVPDVPTFFEAISAWAASHAFPILIDDVELAFKFLRAFRPARIVRFPRRAEPIPDGKLWDVAVAAVGR